MPVCPGCERQVPYDRLPAHEEYCAGLNDADEASLRAMANLDDRLRTTERRLYRRIRAIEAELDITRSRTNGDSPTDERPNERP